MKQIALTFFCLVFFQSLIATANAQETHLSTRFEQKTDHTIDSDSVFFLTDAFLKTKAKSVLNHLLSHFHFTSESQSVGSSPTIQLNQIDVTVSPGSYDISDSGNGVAFVALNNSLRINIGEIAIHEIVQRTVNGVVANIRVDASCKGESLVVTDPHSSISSQLLPVVDGEWLRIRFVNPVVRLVAPKIQMSAYKCAGAEGFQELIDASIKTALQDTKGANGLIAQLIADSTASMSNDLSFNWAAPRLVFGQPNSASDPEGWALPTKISVTPENNWETTGTFRVILPTVVDSNTPYQKFSKWPLEIATNSAYVAVPDSAFLAWVTNYFAPGQWRISGLANSFSGFAGLLKSGFLEFFLWPDMRKYPKTQPFPFVATTMTAPKVAWVSPSSFSLDTNILVQLSTNGAPYADFRTHLQTEMEFSVVTSKVNKVTSTSMVMTAKNPKIKVSYKWAPSYCPPTKHCGSISTGVISGALSEYLKNKKFMFALPAVNFAGTNVQALSVTRDSKSQAMILQLSPN